MNYTENGMSDKEFECCENKSNIFLIGDSIRIGYCEYVKNELSDIAEVFYIKENCRSSQHIITSLEKWKNKFSDPSLIDVVHFNCGHWDVARWSGYPLPLTTESEYAKNIQMIIELLKMKFPNAKIIFATTTTVNPQEMPALNPRDNEIISRYNEIAVKIAEENGLCVNDLNKFTSTWSSDYYEDICHFKKEAYEALGMEVANKLRDFMQNC